MKPVFVDTAGWFTLLDADDRRHAAARKARDRVLRRRGRLVTTDYVVDETLTLLRMRAGLDAAARWWWSLGASDRISIERIGPERTDRALEWFFGWPDQRFSFTDCTSFVVMRELGLERALTSDAHFATAGFELLPG